MIVAPESLRVAVNLSSDREAVHFPACARRGAPAETNSRRHAPAALRTRLLPLHLRASAASSSASASRREPSDSSCCRPQSAPANLCRCMGNGTGSGEAAAGARPKLHHEMKRASSAPLALHPNAAAKQLDNSLGNGQAEACPAELPRDRAVGLRERLEDAVDHLRRNADSRIAHHEVQRDRIFARGFRLNVERDAPFLGELDRVADRD